VKAIIITLIGSLSQIVATVFMGSIGLFYYLFFVEGELNQYLTTATVLLIILLLALILGLYFNVNIFYILFRKVFKLRKIRKVISVITEYHFKELLIVLLLSFLRYSIFTAQYLLLLELFGIDAPFLTGLSIVMLIFLIQTVWPLPALVELGIRGNVAIWFLSAFAVAQISIISATYSLWLINLIIPALIGGLLILNINFLKTQKS